MAIVKKFYPISEDSSLTALQDVLLKASMNLVKLMEKFGLANSCRVGNTFYCITWPCKQTDQY